MSHNHQHSCGHEHDPPPEETSSAQSLYAYISALQIRTLNESAPGAGQGIIKSWEERYDTTRVLESDADEQVIMHIPFSGHVKLKSILLRAPASDQAPRSLKVFVNRDHLDFDSIAEVKPTEVFELVPYANASEISEYPVKVRLFPAVKSLTLFFDANYGADATLLWYLGFRGEFTRRSDKPVIAIYEAAANPADHKVKNQMEVSRTV